MDAGFPDETGPREPHLDYLLGLLTAGPTPAELAGEGGALAMFRQERASGGPERASGSPARRVARWHISRSRLVAAAASFAVVGGFATAAYAAVLPAPVQHVAFRALGFAGVPDAPHASAAPGGSRPAAAAPGRGPGGVRGYRPATGTSPRPGAPAGPSRPAAQPGGSSAAPAASESLSVTVARGRIAAGSAAVLGGRLTHQGTAVAAANLSLLERAAGQPGWRLAGHASTGPGGRAVLEVSGLTTNALFRLASPDGTLSQPVLVIVVPPVSASLVAGPGAGVDELTARSPLAAPGDAVVLQQWAGTRWRSVQASRLDGSAEAGFVVRLRATGRLDRVVLLATAGHGDAVSNLVPVPRR